MLAAIVERLRDSTTYAGVAAVAAAVGWNVHDDTGKNIVQGVIAASGLAAVLLKPRGK